MAAGAAFFANTRCPPTRSLPSEYPETRADRGSFREVQSHAGPACVRNAPRPAPASRRAPDALPRTRRSFAVGDVEIGRKNESCRWNAASSIILKLAGSGFAEYVKDKFHYLASSHCGEVVYRHMNVRSRKANIPAPGESGMLVKSKLSWPGYLLSLIRTVAELGLPTE
jgi:hypothetical protein